VRGQSKGRALCIGGERGCPSLMKSSPCLAALMTSVALVGPRSLRTRRESFDDLHVLAEIARLAVQIAAQATFFIAFLIKPTTCRPGYPGGSGRRRWRSGSYLFSLFPIACCRDI
jgi:hypothetical protein